MMTSSSKLTLGPVLFNWKPETLRDFYFRMADVPELDTVHVGEVVCSKRTPFFEPVIPEIIERLQSSGKEVVLSSLALIMSDRESAAARDLAETGLMVEANDISVAALMGGRSFVAGPLLNIYNEGTLASLEAMGASRICLPAEMSADAIASLAGSAKSEIEVQAFGRLPLAISARCYAARARNLAKDGCQYVCADDPDGMDVETLDEVPFLAVNGTQTMSYHHMDLLGELAGLAARGVTRFRLWPQTCDMAAIARLFRSVLDRRMEVGEAEDALAALCPGAEFANGYIHGRPGHLFIESDV
jgi:collagenase-like PrtC family protease